MPSLKASFVDVLDQLSQLDPPGAQAPCGQRPRPCSCQTCRAAGSRPPHRCVPPPAAALLIDQLLRAHAHAQHLLDLEARRWLSLWRTAHTAGNAARAAARAAVCAACTARLCNEGCLRSHAAFQAHPRTAACETICDALLYRLRPKTAPRLMAEQMIEGTFSFEAGFAP